ncbi:hypothetical protein ACJRO7_031260 [Eucalyptus globulus]|uniref:Ubiquitin-like domain-containing protein n=1 Tax=Eucalyptus globulus TaxID=34317 RepID=A0ABD3JPU0_EUCGL
MFSCERRIFLFDENSLNSTPTSYRTSSPSTTIFAEKEEFDDDGRVALQGVHAASSSSSQLRRSMHPSWDEEEVILTLEISKKLTIVADRNSTVEHIKALIDDKEKINDEYSMQLFFGGRPLKEGGRLTDYGIYGRATIRVLLRDLARMTVIVHIQSAQKYLLLDERNLDTVQDVKLMIQAMEGIMPDDFALFFGGETLPTFYLVLNPKEHLLVFVDMSSRRVRVDAKFWFTVVMSSHLVYRWEQLEDHKTLACHSIADGSILLLVSPYAPFQIFVNCRNGKTVALEVCSSHTIEEVKNKLLDKLPVSVPTKLHGIAYAGKRLIDDCDLASYGI